MTLSAGIASTYPRLYRGVTQDLLTAAASTGPGQIYQLPQDEFGPPTRLSIDVISVGGGASINIEGSDDPSFGTGEVAVLETVSTTGKTFIVDKPVGYIRANLISLVSGTCTVRGTNAGRS
jgi:hypothetical protein